MENLNLACSKTKMKQKTRGREEKYSGGLEMVQLGDGDLVSSNLRSGKKNCSSTSSRKRSGAEETRKLIKNMTFWKSSRLGSSSAAELFLEGEDLDEESAIELSK